MNQLLLWVRIEILLLLFGGAEKVFKQLVGAGVAVIEREIVEEDLQVVGGGVRFWVRTGFFSGGWSGDGGEGWEVGDGFGEFFGFGVGVAEGLFRAKGFEGFLVAVGDAIEFAENDGEVFGFGLIVGEGGEGAVVEGLHLMEAELERDEGVDEGVLGGSYGLKLFE